MNDFKHQFIRDVKGNTIFVIIPTNEYNQMLDKIEELEDIRLYDEVKARNEDTIALEEYVQQRKINKVHA